MGGPGGGARLQVVGGKFFQPLSQRRRARHLLQGQQLLEGLVAAEVLDSVIVAHAQTQQAQVALDHVTGAHAQRGGEAAVENFRRDKPFQQLLTLQKVPSAATLRQRLEKLAANDLQARTATWSTTLLSLIEAPITAETTHVCLDIDTFVMDNSNSKKEGVSRTYQKVDGYTPIAAYL